VDGAEIGRSAWDSAAREGASAVFMGCLWTGSNETLSFTGGRITPPGKSGGVDAREAWTTLSVDEDDCRG